MLAEHYWQPLYAYVRRRWRLEPDRAAELTQDLFVHDLEREIFGRFDPGRARFRTYLRACADNLARDHARRRAAAKRAGTTADADVDKLERELAGLDAALTAEDAFDEAWRQRIVALARERLDASLRARGKPVHADVFAMFLDEDPPPSYADAAARLGISVTDVTNWLHAAKREFRVQLSVVLREGGATETELREELKRLG
jgi:RNA polymerase sigma factor (sigma-70 family)